jgi:CRP-like cAMP-binding protein
MFGGSSITRREALARLSLFEGLDPKALARIDALSTEMELCAGRILTREGTVGREAFVIMAGQVEVTCGDARVSTLGPGSVLGEMALVDGSVRTATATTVTDVRLLVLDTRAFWSLLDEPVVARRVLQAAAARRRATAAGHPSAGQVADAHPKKAVRPTAGCC